MRYYHATIRMAKIEIKIKTNKIQPDKTKFWWGWSATGISCIANQNAQW